MRFTFGFIFLVVSQSILALSSIHGFSILRSPSAPSSSSLPLARRTATRTRLYADSDPNWLMAEYRDPTSGEVLDPYEILKIPRHAERQEIKQAYRALSRRYHPDVMITRDILPGSCNNMEDVRNHWERVKLSYEILSDPLRRKRYDRNEAWTDPGRAVKRAAQQAAMDAVVSAGKGMWGFGTSIGASVIKEVAKAADQAAKKARIDEKLKLKHQKKAAIAASSSIMKWKPDNRDGQQQQLVEMAVRSRIDQTLEVSRAHTRPALFRNPEKKQKKHRGLRSLYDLGMLPEASQQQQP